MKKILLIALSAVTLIVGATPVAAYEVTVKNNTAKKLIVQVIGEHLFWQTEDCSIQFSAGQKTGSCATPTGICIAKVWITWDYEGVTKTLQCLPYTPIQCANKTYIIRFWNPGEYSCGQEQ